MCKKRHSFTYLLKCFTRIFVLYHLHGTYNELPGRVNYLKDRSSDVIQQRNRGSLDHYGRSIWSRRSAYFMTTMFFLLLTAGVLNTVTNANFVELLPNVTWAGFQVTWAARQVVASTVKMIRYIRSFIHINWTSYKWSGKV